MNMTLYYTAPDACKRCGTFECYKPRNGKKTGYCVKCMRESAKASDKRRREREKAGLQSPRVRNAHCKRTIERIDETNNNVLAYYLARRWA